MLTTADRCRRGRRRLRPTRRDVRRLAPVSSKGSPTSGRACSSSRTCIGRTMVCSTSSTASSTGRRMCRSSSSRPRGRSCSRAARTGAVGSRTRRRCRSRRSRKSETAELVHAVLERAVLPADVQAAVLARAGGNPLYAEEFARLVVERGAAADGELPVPDSLQGLISARLDALTRAEKELLQDAAVLGKVFWRGALIDPNARSEQVDEALRTARAEGVRAPRPALVGRGRGAVRVPARPRPRRRVCADPTCRPSRATSAGGGVDRVAGARRGRCRAARPPLRERARVCARGGCRRGRPRARRAGTHCATPGAAPLRSTPSRTRRASTRMR